MTNQTGNEAKRKLDESLALLNSLFAHPTKRHSADPTATQSDSTVHHAKEQKATPHETVLSAKQHSSLKKRVFLPPRPSVLDKLSRLTSSRPTLQDSIAASIAASAPAARAPALAGSMVVNVDGETPATATEEVTRVPLSKRVGSVGSTKMRYLPWSRDQFHERLETFKPSTWFDKPKQVNAIECAKRGWINKGDDRLECCGGCGGVVIVRIDQIEDKSLLSTENGTHDPENKSATDISSDDFGLDDALLDMDVESLGPKFQVMLTSNHVTGCPWKTHPCDEFQDRVNQLGKMKNDPLTENIRHPLTVEEVERLSGLFSGDTGTKLLILSLFGWSASETPKILACEACHTHCTYIPSFGFRRAGVQDGVVQDGGDMLMDEDEEEEEASFDAIQAHKWYCYWVDPEHNERRQAGWRIFHKLLTSGSSGQLSQDQVQNSQLDASSSTTAPGVEPSEAVAMVKRILRGQVALF
ncbi:hypothetical protein BGZ95_005623 [Linnemannia exigua]|uniref:Zf-C3HC-domain-containing protein n=1 Tax=Linnemannia exigua TaxID=604196 RepID=A0AAD4HAX7_9FUNG|nr:hypothetical protein BGZ95_005623 [Linnemannia exigua]